MKHKLQFTLVFWFKLWFDMRNPLKAFMVKTATAEAVVIMHIAASSSSVWLLTWNLIANHNNIRYIKNKKIFKQLGC